MPLTSYQKVLNKIRSNIKYELGELTKMVEAHPDFFDQYSTTDSMMVESGLLLSHKIQRTSARLLEQIEFITTTKPTKKKLQVHNDLEGSNTCTGDAKPVRKRGRKAKVSS